MSMSSTINVHRPEVEAGELGVYRSESSGDLTITLASNSSLRVTMFATDEQWDTIVDRVAEFRRGEHVNESAPPRRYALSSPYVDETDMAETEVNPHNFYDVD